MFIRRVQTRPRPGSPDPYTSFRLVRSERAGSSVRQLTLLNLGADFAVPPQQWPALIDLLDTLRSGLHGRVDRVAALCAPATQRHVWRQQTAITY